MADNSIENYACAEPPRPLIAQNEPQTGDQPTDAQGKETRVRTKQNSHEAPYDEWEFDRLLLNISKELTDEDTENLVFRFSGALGKAVQEKIKKPMHLLRILKKRHWLTAENLLILQAALRDIERMDLVRVTAEYAQKMDNVLYFYQPTESVNGYKSVKFHLYNCTCENTNRDHIQTIRLGYSVIIGCAPEKIVIVGLEPATSLILTFHVPDYFVCMFKELVKMSSCKARLRDMGIDMVEIEGEDELFHCSDGDVRTKPTTEEQKKLYNVYQLLKNKEELLDSAEAKRIELDEKIETLENEKFQCVALLKSLKPEFVKSAGNVSPEKEDLLKILQTLLQRPEQPFLESLKDLRRTVTGTIMTSNEPSLMERRLRQTILSWGQEFLSYKKQLNTEALLVITVDEDTRTRSVVNVSDVIMNKSSQMNESRPDRLKMVLEESMKSTILETMELGNSINLLGIVTYQVDDGSYYVIKLDFEVNKDNRQEKGSSSSTSLINDGMQHEDDVSLDSSGSGMAEQNDANFDSLSRFDEEFYKSIGLKVNENKDVTCQKCYTPCDDIKSLQVHNSLKHQGFTCLVCGNMLTNKHNLKRHIKVAHMPGNKECVFCKKKFHYDSDLKKHIRLTHGNKITSNSSQKPTFYRRRDGNEMKPHFKSMTKTLQDMTKTRVSADRQQIHSNIGMKSSIKQNVTKSHKQKLPSKLTSLPSNKEHTGEKRQLGESSRVSPQSMHTGSFTELGIPKKKNIVHQSHKPPSEVIPSAPKKKKIVLLQNNDFNAAVHDANMKNVTVVNQAASGIKNATQIQVSTMDVKVENEVTGCGFCGMQFTRREYLVMHWRKNPHHIS